MIAIAGDTGACSAVLAVLNFARRDFHCEGLAGAMAPSPEKP